MSRQDDAAHMARALDLAANGIYAARPNPTVGCVLVRGERVVGAGWTAPPGGPHAEVAALANAGELARGATAYVTLEPCSHWGRTGPCSTALADAGVARVVCAMLDPNPLVSGGGVEALRSRGIDVEVGVLEAAARESNRGYLARMTRGRPWVRSKLAASLDGRTALANGESQWITGVEARRDVHLWRARSGAVLTGIGTVLKDDPALTARPETPIAGQLQPLRVIVDGHLRTPGSARTLALPGEVIIFTRQEEAEAALRFQEERTGEAQMRVETVGGLEHCNLREVLERLAELEINDIWVEAGAGLNGALIESGLVDELVIYFAPQLLGDSARGMFSIKPPASLSDRIELAIDDVRRVGDDLRILARPISIERP